MAQNIEPFQVHLQDFGTFGGKFRGCLWMYPKSFREKIRKGDVDTLDCQSGDELEPLVHLQAALENFSPQCNDVKKISGNFFPHLTLSHFPSLDEALEGQRYLLETWGDHALEYKKALTFHVKEIYILLRKGDDGQFTKIATIELGSEKREKWIQIHDPSLPFLGMPEIEDDVTRIERINLKERRNKNGRKRRARRDVSIS